jgi:hypothetical protein
MWPPASEQAPPGHQLYNPLQPAPGIYALSVTSLHGVVLGEQRDAFAWFREQAPVARLGGSIFLYEVPPQGEPIDLVLLGVQPGELAPAVRGQLAGNDLRVRWLNDGSALLWPAGGGWLVIGDGQEVGEEVRPFLTTTLVVEADGQRLYRLLDPPVAESSAYSFADQLALLDVQFLGLENSSELTFTTRWQVLNPTGRPLKIFIHALDEQGQLLGQWDGLSVEASSWQRGDIFVHHHQFALSSAENLTHFLIGLYDGETLERLGEPLLMPVQQPVPNSFSGEPWESRHKMRLV